MFIVIIVVTGRSVEGLVAEKPVTAHFINDREKHLERKWRFNLGQYSFQILLCVSSDKGTSKNRQFGAD